MTPAPLGSIHQRMYRRIYSSLWRLIRIHRIHVHMDLISTPLQKEMGSRCCKRRCSLACMPTPGTHLSAMFVSAHSIQKKTISSVRHSPSTPTPRRTGAVMHYNAEPTKASWASRTPHEGPTRMLWKSNRGCAGRHRKTRTKDKKGKIHWAQLKRSKLTI